MRLDGPPALEIKKAFRGIVDFYCWRGIHCARKWPSKPHQPNTPAQLITLGMIPYAQTWIKTLDTPVIADIRNMTFPTGMTYTDFLRKIGSELYYGTEP